MNDERKSLPSASSVERYAACPGSWELSKKVKERAATASQLEWAESGNRIHAWLENPAIMQLPPAEQEVADACLREVGKLMDEVFGGPDGVVTHPEKRLWLEKRFSGKADLIAIKGNVALVVDYKTSRGDVEASSTNLQLRSLAVLVAEHYKEVESICVAIVQPLVKKSVSCMYEKHHVEMARQELVEVLDSISKSDAPINPGEHCKYCPAALICPMSAKIVESIAEVKDVDGLNMEELCRLLDLIKVAKPLFEKIETRARSLIEQGVSVGSWTLEPSGQTREVTDAIGAFAALEREGLLNRDIFLSECVSVSIGDVEAAVAKFKGLKKLETKNIVNACCSEFIKLKDKKPSLKKIKS